MKNWIYSLVITIQLLLILSLTGCQSNDQSSKEIITRHNIDEVMESPPITQKTENITKHTVVIEQMKFNPEELTIHKGDTVVWINKGIVDHDISEFPNKIWTSGSLKIGDSWEKVPTESFNYFCSIHMTMKGSIKVID